MGRVGRPRTEIGTYGEIKVSETGPPFIARARFRLRNGRLKDVTRSGPSKAAATRRLKKALTQLADEVAGKNINGETRMTHVMDLWLVDFAEKVTLGKRQPGTLEEYRYIVNNHLRPLMGDLACREAENAGLCNETLKTVRKQSTRNTKRAKTGEAAMLRARTVLSHVCKFAVLHDAMKVNPVKSIETIDRDREEVRALEPEDRADFLAKFRAECESRTTGPARKGQGVNRLGVRAKVWTDLPELVEAMLSTGLRIGEALALIGDSVDLDARLVHASHHVVREGGVGLVRRPKRKGDRPGLQVAVVSWTESMWRRRKLASGGAGPLFATWTGQWLDPGNVAKKIREVCDAIGYGWVSARMFRHTAGTHLADSGLSVHEAADALGNTPAVMEKHYRRKQKSNPKVAAALETMLASGVDTPTGSV